MRSPFELTEDVKGSQSPTVEIPSALKTPKPEPSRVGLLVSYHEPNSIFERIFEMKWGRDRLFLNWERGHFKNR